MARYYPIKQAMAPQKVLVFNCFLVLVVAFGSTQYLAEQPYYDLNPRVDQDQILVKADPAGYRSLAAIEHQHQPIPVDPQDIRPDPDFLNSFNAIDHYFTKQSLILTALEQDKMILLSEAGDRFSVARKERAWSSLPPTFWLLNFYAAIALITGIAFWAYHRGRAITRILAIGGAGCYLMQVTMAVYASRELALDGSVFRALLHLNHLGGILFVSSLVVLLLFYPSPLPHRRYVYLVYAAAILIWLNEIVAWIEWPVSLFYFPALPLTAFALWLFRIQWKRSLDEPRKRRMYLWLVSSILAGIGLTFAVYVVPILISGVPLVSTWVANTFCLLVFMGFVLGVQFSGLFSVERWWLKACMNVLLAFAVILMDLVAISLLGVQSALGLSILAIACFWIYLQLRERCWKKISGISGPRFFMKGIYSDPEYQEPEAGESRYLPEKELMCSLYQPLAVEHIDMAFAKPIVLENGLKLGVTIPPKAVDDAIGEPVNLIFVGKRKGQDVFTAEDAEFANGFIEHARETHRLHLAREATLLAERQRIMRDLHDEVAPDLLSLVRKLEGTSQQDKAQICLSNLRDIVYSMDDDRERSLREAVSRWRRELGDMADTAGVGIEWQDELTEDRVLSGTQWLHLSKSIRELVSNALRHAGPSRISIKLWMADSELQISVINDGHIEAREQWKSGKGIASVTRRVNELLGSISWEKENQQCKAHIQVPL